MCQGVKELCKNEDWHVDNVMDLKMMSVTMKISFPMSAQRCSPITITLFWISLIWRQFLLP